MQASSTSSTRNTASIVDAGAVGAALLLSGVLAVAAVPLLLIGRQVFSPGLTAVLIAMCIGSLSVNVLHRRASSRSLAVMIVALDVLISLAVASLTDAQAMPLGWLALLVPVATSAALFGLANAIAVWTAVSFAFAGLVFNYGTADYTSEEMIRLVIQQVVASVAIIGPIGYFLRQNQRALRQLSNDRRSVSRRLSQLVAVGDVAMRLARADDDDSITREVVTAVAQTGFARAEVWKEQNGEWTLLGSGGGQEVADGAVLAILNADHGTEGTRRYDLDDRGTDHARMLFASGYQSVVSLTVIDDRNGHIRLVAYDASAAQGQQQLDALEIIAEHAASAWHKSSRVLELRRWAKRLSHQATHDALTGLSNRAGLFEHLRRLSNEEPRMVLFFDLNGFKAINDTHGHDAGDAVLQAIASRLNGLVGSHGGFVGRLGGDEFVVTLPVSALEVATACEIMIAAIEEPIVVDDVPHIVGTSIGVALPAEDRTSEEQLRLADAAMYTAKATKANGSSWEFSERDHAHRTATRRTELTR